MKKAISEWILWITMAIVIAIIVTVFIFVGWDRFQDIARNVAHNLF